MWSYLRQWNDDGDYIELPPYSIHPDYIEIDVWGNDGSGMPTAQFKFYKEDLLDLAKWATEMANELSERKTP